MFDANRFGNRDLHVIDIATIPHGLKNPIRGSKHQNILNGLFAEIMIDTINLVHVENGFDVAVQCLHRFVKSPLAPKITITHAPGEAILTSTCSSFIALPASLVF